MKNMSKRRQYAAHFNHPDKPVKEMGIVKEWLELFSGRYHSPVYGPHPNYAPDCIVLDKSNRKIAVEVCELVDRIAVESNLAGRRIYRKYGKEDFLNSLEGILKTKDSKKYHGRYSKIIILVHTDEPDLFFERCREWLKEHIFFHSWKIKEAYLIFSYDPVIKRYQCIRIKLSKKTFRDRVFGIVKRIPKGRTLTYKEVAEKAGSPRAYRAVGNILNKNYDTAIPCHRVVRSDGNPGGWNRGAQRKAEMLRKEKIL